MTKHTVSAAATGLPEFTRRKALLPIAALVSVGAFAATRAAMSGTKSDFMQAAEAYKSLYSFNSFGEDDAGVDEWGRQMELSEHRLLQTPMTSNRDAAELARFIQVEELSDAGDEIALDKLIQFLSA